MKRFLGFSLAMLFALIGIALVGGESGAVAGHGCHGARRCHGGLFAKKHACHGREKCHGLFGKHRRCHGEAVECCECEPACGCESSCGGCETACGGCETACGGCESGCGGCAGGDCGGEGVISSEGVPTEAAPAEAPKAPAEST